MTRRIAHAALLKFHLTPIVLVSALLALALVPAALAGGGATQGSKRHAVAASRIKSGGCTPGTPGVAVQNTYGWGQSGSWGLRGQRLGYQVRVDNLDVGCGSTTFTLTVSAPGGFSVEIPTSTVSLRSGTSAYLWVYATSPGDAVDGDYPLTVTVTRSASGATASQVTQYKVYSSDSAPPTLFFSNPSDGETLSGSSYTFAVWSNDDHAVQKIELYIDGVYRTTATCDGVAYNCALSYRWSLRHVHGQHTATFQSYDWWGNVATLPVTFTVS
jgi:Bacterial Ig domain